MAWIESHQEVGGHPKTKKLARLLGVSLPAAVGHLHYLWWWATDYAQDGNLSRFDAYDIKDATHFEGDENTLIKALIESGYIDVDGDGKMHLHDWFEYAGKLAERRAKDRARKRASSTGTSAEIRQKSKGDLTEIQSKTEGNPTESKMTSDGTPTESARIPYVPNLTQPNITKHNLTKPNQTEPNHSAGDPPIQERRFAEFWLAYPKKVGKASCLKAWLKLKPNAELFERIMTALDKQKTSDQWQREGGRFIPNPLTWINQGRWDDEPVGASAPVAQTSTGTSGILNKLREMYAAEGGDDS